MSRRLTDRKAGLALYAILYTLHEVPGLQCFPLTATSHDRRTAICATDYEKILTGVEDTVSVWVFRCVSFKGTTYLGVLEGSSILKRRLSLTNTSRFLKPEQVASSE